MSDNLSPGRVKQFLQDVTAQDLSDDIKEGDKIVELIKDGHKISVVI